MTEPASSPNGWTTSALKAYIDQRFGDSDKATSALKAYIDQRFGDSDKAVASALVAADKLVMAALVTQKEAVAKAEAATDKRFETARQEADFRMNALGEKIDLLQAAMNQGSGRRDQEITARSGTQWAATTTLGFLMFAAIVVSGILGALHI